MGDGGGVEIVREGTWKELMLALRRDRRSERLFRADQMWERSEPRRACSFEKCRCLGRAGVWDVKAGQVGRASDHGGFNRSY